MDFRTDVWASALMRRAEIGGASAFLNKRGDAERGAVLVKVATLDGRARLFEPALGPNGDTIWLDVTRAEAGDPEADIDAAVALQLRRDPDLWVIEIEDRAGRHFLTEPIAPRRS
jgi:hypothetical protein